MIGLIIGVVWLGGMIVLAWFNRKNEAVREGLEFIGWYILFAFWAFMVLIPLFLILNYFMTH